MVKIRLTRIGEKKVPLYRIVVADSKTPRNGQCIEEIGTYDPNTNPGTVKVDAELAKKWLANGAQPTTVVSKLFRQAGINK
ncbi:MAG: 30S ribosomal protein S16 [Eubacteriales bacterium]|nr:30S ribosomal protein S16 [Eubacteriales bacterium]